MKIIGMKFMMHDSALCVIDTKKKEIFATSTERVTRIKHDWVNISPILKEYKDKVSNPDLLAHSFSLTERPYFVIKDKLETLWRQIERPKYVKDCTPKNERLKKLQYYFFKNPATAFKYIALLAVLQLVRVCNKLNLTCYKNLSSYIKDIFLENGIHIKSKVQSVEHHLAHAASAFLWFDSSDEEKLILTIDGEGDGYFSKLFIFQNGDFKEIAASESCAVQSGRSRFSGSVGIIYGNFTEALGLRRDSDEGKVEALAAYGKANEKIVQELLNIFEIKDLSLKLDSRKARKFYNQDYLSSLRKSLGDEDFSATIQTWLERLMVSYTRKIKKAYPNIKTLYLAGGVAANVIMNLKIYEESGFEKIVVVPPMGDDGTALGAAVYTALRAGEDLSWLQNKKMPYFGHKINKEELKVAFEKYSDFIKVESLSGNWYKDLAENVYNGKVVAIVDGPSEFGPRALGGRSIVANPKDPNLKDRINGSIKRRPWYQPFCPSVLSEERERLFEKSFDHKHMAIAFRIKQEYADKIPSAIHIDKTARPQFVSPEDNENYYKILHEFKKLSGFGVLINTSFNLHGRAMVRSADDAIRDFLDCNIDLMYIDGYKITRK